MEIRTKTSFLTVCALASSRIRGVPDINDARSLYQVLLEIGLEAQAK